VPKPSENESFLGLHALLVVGTIGWGSTYYFIVRNSWGKNWG